MLATPKTTQQCCQSPRGRGIAQSLPCTQALFYSPLWCELIAPSSQRLYMLGALWLIELCWAGMAGKLKKKKNNTRASRGTGRDWTSSSRTLVIVFSSRSTPPLLHHHKCTSLLIQQSLLSVWLPWCAKPCRNVKDCEIKFLFKHPKDVNLKWSL